MLPLQTLSNALDPFALLASRQGVDPHASVSYQRTREMTID